jgi:hypothetical protein
MKNWIADTAPEIYQGPIRAAIERSTGFQVLDLPYPVGSKIRP